MKKWYNIVLEGKGYIGVKVSQNDAIKIYELLQKLDITIDYNDLHATLIYDKSNPELNYNPDVKSYVSYPIDIQMMGKPESDYYSIALIVVSPELEKKHNELKELGFKHSYSEFKPHISLKYKPTQSEIDIIMSNKDMILRSLREIKLDSEWNQELHS